MADQLALKWGTAKRWKIESDEAKEAWARYCQDPNCISAAMQHDTDAQKQALMDLCDIVEKGGSKIYLCWDSIYVSAAEAKDYIRNYETTDA